MIMDAIYVPDLEVDMSLYARLLREKREEVRQGWAVPAEKDLFENAQFARIGDSPVPRPPDAEQRLMRFGRGVV